MDCADREMDVIYSMGTELASHLLEDSVNSVCRLDTGDMNGSLLYNPSGIDLHLECEDDKSYDLPVSKYKLHSSASMRISLGPPTGAFSCKYCKCNFLSESHLGQHMQQFHLGCGDDNEDTLEQPEGRDEDLAASSSVSSRSCHSLPSPQAATTYVPKLFATGETKKLKKLKLRRKPGKMKARREHNPPVTLTIKKSMVDSAILEREQAPAVRDLSPVPMIQVKCEVQSDSANETIDVESSSPSSSPSAVKSRLAAGFNLKKHVPKNAKKPFTCTTCMKSYVSKYALKRHIATHSDERPFICTFPKCKGAFKLKSRLTDHLRYVHKCKTQRTVKRSKSLPVTTAPALAQALLSPTQLSPANGGLSDGEPNSFSAQFLASLADNLEKNSQKSSANLKPFKCNMPNCNRAFRDSHNLHIHMCLHTGHRPLKCPQCEYSCVQKSSLDWHMKNTHSESL